VDHNQKEIVEALRKAGASVLVTSNVGKGFPDIIVGLAGKNWLIEIKNPKSSYGKTGLNKIQKDFHSTWTGRVHVIYSIDEALKLIGLI
jgi:Holliday junction resolvase